MDDKIFHELLDLCLRINRETELAAWFDFAGHVNSFSVRVAKNKKDFTELLYNSYAYPEYSIEEFHSMKAILEKYLAGDRTS